MAESATHFSDRTECSQNEKKRLANGALFAQRKNAFAPVNLASATVET